MRHTYRTLLVIGLCFGMNSADGWAREPDPVAVSQDRQRIEGVWKVVAFEIDGDPVPPGNLDKLTLIDFADGTWRLLHEDVVILEGTSRIDPTGKPKTVDFRPGNGGEFCTQYQGIYEVDDRTRKVCFAPLGNLRPTEFVSTSESLHVLITLEKVSITDAKERSAAPSIPGRFPMELCPDEAACPTISTLCNPRPLTLQREEKSLPSR